MEALVREGTKGNESAAYMLAVIYEKGSGVRPDPAKAREWLRRAVLLRPGAVLARAARDCLLLAVDIERSLAGGAQLNSLASQIEDLRSRTERFRMAVGFAQSIVAAERK
jgi:hypothetical protein